MDKKFVITCIIELYKKYNTLSPSAKWVVDLELQLLTTVLPFPLWKGRESWGEKLALFTLYKIISFVQFSVTWQRYPPCWPCYWRVQCIQYNVLLHAISSDFVEVRLPDHHIAVTENYLIRREVLHTFLISHLTILKFFVETEVQVFPHCTSSVNQ